MYRSNYCGLVTSKNIDEEVTLCGWVDRRRDHGGVIFVDLRDREGIVQRHRHSSSTIMLPSVKMFALSIAIWICVAPGCKTACASVQKLPPQFAITLSTMGFWILKRQL